MYFLAPLELGWLLNNFVAVLVTNHSIFILILSSMQIFSGDFDSDMVKVSLNLHTKMH